MPPRLLSLEMLDAGHESGKLISAPVTNHTNSFNIEVTIVSSFGWRDRLKFIVSLYTSVV